jgi:hypothetical protein
MDQRKGVAEKTGIAGVVKDLVRRKILAVLQSKVLTWPTRFAFLLARSPFLMVVVGARK